MTFLYYNSLKKQKFMFHYILDIEYNFATKSEKVVFILSHGIPFWVKIWDKMFRVCLFKKEHIVISIW